jgi:uncharacterized protein YegP (UPF0339 family)
MPLTEQEKRLDRQVSQSAEEVIIELPTACDRGTKRNAKGYKPARMALRKKNHQLIAMGEYYKLYAANMMGGQVIRAK